MNKLKSPGLAKLLALLLCVTIILTAAIGCSATVSKSVKLDPRNPITISVWHYYNGTIMNSFNMLINEFNETVGLEKGIIVESFAHGSVSELEKDVISSANKEIGSRDMPNIFASYADTAYEAEKLGILANLGDYLTDEEQSKYLDSYIEEGKIGLNGELRIFPVAKSTEILMVNETDWLPFANENGITYDELKTVEGITRTAEKYYNWTDSLTPDIPNDGKAFYGRDSMANLFIITSKEFDTELFHVDNGTAAININEDVMRKIWDNYYIPYISGYFYAYGRYRSDDAKVGDILAYVGSTSSVSYFPSDVTASERVYPITAKVLPVPHFEGAQKAMVQQGAGMVVTKAESKEEYASVEFLKWFTDVDENIKFSLMSGYTPVMKEAIDYELIKSRINDSEVNLTDITDETLRIAIEGIKTSVMYTNKAFTGGADARWVLDHNLHDKAVADRELVLKKLETGSTLDEATSGFRTEDNFRAWLEDITEKLIEAAK